MEENCVVCTSILPLPSDDSEQNCCYKCTMLDPVNIVPTFILGFMVLWEEIF